MPTAPPVLTPAPTSPDRSDRATFSARAIALDDWTKNVHVSELQAAINSAYANAVAAAGSSAALAAIAWVSGTTYAIGDARYSPIDFQTYRRKTAGAGTTDPSLDGTNWARVNLASGSVTRTARTSNTILAEADRASLIDITSGTFSQTFTAAATLGSGWYCYIRNAGTGVSAELINGAATLAVKPGQTVLVQCDGTGLYAMVTEAVVGDHSVFVTTGNGHGSTNTKIRRFTTTQSSSGSAITYADSATLGATFTINSAGLYAITYADSASAGAQNFGVSVNSAQLTSDIVLITAANRLGMTFSVGAGLGNALTIVALLAAGDVLRAHDAGSNNDAGAATSYFSIRKIGS
jgi:hypothetical protein